MKEWQKDRIDIIKKILPKLGENYVLKGGTALLLYYSMFYCFFFLDLIVFCLLRKEKIYE